MTERMELERIVADWLRANAPARADEQVLATALARVAVTKQQRTLQVRLIGDRRRFPVTVKLALLGALLLLALALAGGALIGGALPVLQNNRQVPTTVPQRAPPYVPLAAGRYFLLGPANMLGWPGAVSLTVPEGWTMQGSYRGGGLRRYQDARNPQGPESLEAMLEGWSVGRVVTTPCPESPPTTNAGDTIDELVAAMTSIQGIQSSAPADATLAGFRGKFVELRLPTRTGCDWLGLWEGPAAGEKWSAASPEGWLHQVWILDVDGQRFVIDASHAADAPADLRDELRQMVDSIAIVP